MTKQIIILNGPPGSGKDAIADLLVDTLEAKAVKHKFAQRLHEIAVVMSGMSLEEWQDIYGNRSTREVETMRLFGFSPRQFIIHIAEEMCKRSFGPQYFVDAAVAQVYNSLAEVIVFSDGGFPAEYKKMSTEFGHANVKLIHVSRWGCNFSIDSRRYITGAFIHPHFLRNNGTLQQAVSSIILDIMN